jgi:hypothetical protein
MFQICVKGKFTIVVSLAHRPARSRASLGEFENAQPYNLLRWRDRLDDLDILEDNVKIELDWLTMSMGREYVSELWPSTGLLFTLQVIYEHEEPWWNGVTGDNSWFVHQRALWKS